jgi:hypothetical protein
VSRSFTLLTGMLLTASLLAGGCDWFRRPVIVPPGTVVELAKPAKFSGLVTDEKTGKRSIRTVEAEKGWLIGPAEPASEVK